MLCAFHGLTGDMLHAALGTTELPVNGLDLSNADVAGAVGICALVLMLAAWCWSWASASRADAGSSGQQR